MRPSYHTQRQRAFTLVELIISLAMLISLMLFLFTGTDAASRAWRDGRERIDAYQSGRTTLEMAARELAPAVVDTRMQMVVAPAEELISTGSAGFAENSPAILWMAPLGPNGALRCVGYFLTRDAQRKFYRMKRLYIAPQDEAGVPSRYFPRLASAKDPADTTRLLNPRDLQLRPSATDARWFTRDWDAGAFDEARVNGEPVVSSVADGVIAFWVQSFDRLGNPIPWASKSKLHPTTKLLFNSAAYFQMATSPQQNAPSFNYLAEGPQSMRANRLPAAVELTIVTLDAATLSRAAELPAQTNEVDGNGYLDVEASLETLKEDLAAQHIYQARTFRLRAPLINGN